MSASYGTSLMLPHRADDPQRLSRIETLATMIRQAHVDIPEIRTSAQAQMLERYSSAVHRYLVGATHDEGLADELFQEFAVRFLRGDFRHFQPERGRFRQYLKSSLSRLVSEYRTRRQPLPTTPLDADLVQRPEAEVEFQGAWRSELFAGAWTRLQEYELSSGQPDFTVLHYRMQHPELRSQQLAAALAPTLGPHVDVNWMRKRLHHARNKFADALLEQVAQSLTEPSQAALAEELAELELLEFCRTALERWRHS